MANDFANLMAPFMSQQARGLLMTVGLWDIIDIIIVAVILYKLYEMLDNTRAIPLVKGLIILLLITGAARLLDLHVFYWVLEKSLTFLLLAIPIIFHPELRRTLEHIGEGKFFAQGMLIEEENPKEIITAINDAVMQMSAERVGALIVFERNMGLNDITEKSGIPIDGRITADLLRNIFVVNTPLHDGAVIIRGKRIIAAGCILPLTNSRLSTELGTRHRAAIGVSEQYDSLVVVVSEETGTISVTEDGKIVRHLNSDQLKAYLRRIFVPERSGVTIKDIIAKWGKKK